MISTIITALAGLAAGAYIHKLSVPTRDNEELLKVISKNSSMMSAELNQETQDQVKKLESNLAVISDKVNLISTKIIEEISRLEKTLTVLPPKEDKKIVPIPLSRFMMETSFDSVLTEKKIDDRSVIQKKANFLHIRYNVPASTPRGEKIENPVVEFILQGSANTRSVSVPSDVGENIVRIDITDFYEENYIFSMSCPGFGKVSKNMLISI